jgi:hypothetical protein
MQEESWFQQKTEGRPTNAKLCFDILILSRPAGRQGLKVRPQNDHQRSRRVAVPVSYPQGGHRKDAE